jgi:glycosyltransferase involved in cell wall biosynthesis
MTRKRKILMITPYIPRLHQSGGQRSSFYSIKYLAPQNDITLICISPDNAGLSEVKKYCSKVIVIKRGKTWDIRKIIATGFSLFPFLLTKYMSPELRSAIKNELDHQHYDLIHCDCLYPMPSIPPTKTPIILVDVTIEYAIYQHYTENLRGLRRLLAPLLWIDVLKLKYWETYYWKHTHTVVMFSDEDQKFVTKVTGRRDIEVFEDGVDPRYFNFPQKTAKSPYPSILFGVSNMKWMQNRESVHLILSYYWPLILKQYSDAKLYIIGRFAPDFFGEYASGNIIVSEADAEGGPKDPQYYYEHCWLLFAPMGSGGGTRNKFLEGMTFGLPVITTEEGGMGSIRIVNYRHAIVCPSKDILKNTLELISDGQNREKIGEAARLLIKNNYSFEKCVEGLNQIYEKITAPK